MVSWPAGLTRRDWVVIVTLTGKQMKKTEQTPFVTGADGGRPLSKAGCGLRTPLRQLNFLWHLNFLNTMTKAALAVVAAAQATSGQRGCSIVSVGQEGGLSHSVSESISCSIQDVSTETASGHERY